MSFNNNENRQKWAEQEAQKRWGYQNIHDFEK